VTPAATNAGKKLLEDAIKRVGDKWLDDKLGSDTIEAMTKMRDKLKLKNEIEKLKKNDPNDDRSWKDKTEELRYRKEKEKYDADKAAAAKKAAEDARKANDQRSREEYEKTNTSYRHNYNVGRQYTQSSNTWSGKVAGLLESPKADTGRKYLESGAPYELLDGDGNVIMRYR
jgi:hypothetical protein